MCDCCGVGAGGDDDDQKRAPLLSDGTSKSNAARSSEGGGGRDAGGGGKGDFGGAHGGGGRGGAAGGQSASNACAPHMSVQARDEATEEFYRTRSDPVTAWLEQHSGGQPPVDLTQWRDALRRLGVEEHEDIAYVVERSDLEAMGMSSAEMSRFLEAQQALEARLEG